jgi:hypothetical protein
VTLDELPGWARELVATARLARLGSLNERDLPRVLPVTWSSGAGQCRRWRPSPRPAHSTRSRA